jgi:hypothetical protein
LTNRGAKNGPDGVSKTDSDRLNKSSPSRTHSDTSRRYEQKHFLHNWSNCRYYNRPEIARNILGARVASQFVLPKESSLLTLSETAAFRFALRDKADGFLELKFETNWICVTGRNANTGLLP